MEPLSIDSKRVLNPMVEDLFLLDFCLEFELLSPSERERVSY